MKRNVVSLPPKSNTIAIQNDTKMATTIVRKTKSFRLRSDLLEGLQRNAQRTNRSLNNYVESVLLDVIYHEPNAVTKAAIEEAMSRKEYPKSELYNNVEDLFQALDTE